MSNEQNPPESRDHRTDYGQTTYKRALAYKHLGIEPAQVPCIPFFRASLTRVIETCMSAIQRSEKLPISGIGAGRQFASDFRSHGRLRVGIVPSAITRSTSLAGILTARRPTRTCDMRRAKSQARMVDSLSERHSAACAVVSNCRSGALVSISPPIAISQ